MSVQTASHEDRGRFLHKASLRFSTVAILKSACRIEDRRACFVLWHVRNACKHWQWKVRNLWQSKSRREYAEVGNHHQQGADYRASGNTSKVGSAKRGQATVRERQPRSACPSDSEQPSIRTLRRLPDTGPRLNTATVRKDLTVSHRENSDFSFLGREGSITMRFL